MRHRIGRLARKLAPAVIPYYAVSWDFTFRANPTPQRLAMFGEGATIITGGHSSGVLTTIGPLAAWRAWDQMRDRLARYDCEHGAVVLSIRWRKTHRHHSILK